MEKRASVNYGHLAVYLREKRIIIKDVGWQEGCLDLSLVLEQIIPKFDELWSQVRPISVL